MSKRRSPLVSSAVPYVNDRVLEEAKQYLPQSPDEMLNVNRTSYPSLGPGLGLKSGRCRRPSR